MDELEKYYTHYSQNRQKVYNKLLLPELTIQYKHFAIWQKDYMTGVVLDKQLNYWKNKLNGMNY